MNMINKIKVKIRLGLLLLLIFLQSNIVYTQNSNVASLEVFSYYTRQASFFDTLTQQITSNSSTCDFSVGDHVSFFCSSGYAAVHPVVDFLARTAASSLKEL